MKHKMIKTTSIALMLMLNAPIQALNFEKVNGDGEQFCSEGFYLADKDIVLTDFSNATSQLGLWDIARLKDGWALRGNGYNNDFKVEPLQLGHSLCVQDYVVEEDSSTTLNVNWTNSGGRDAYHENNANYTFILDKEQEISFDLQANIDTYLYLLSSNDSLIAYNDDGGNGTNSRLNMTLAPGTYRIVAATYSSGKSDMGSITISDGTLINHDSISNAVFVKVDGDKPDFPPKGMLLATTTDVNKHRNIAESKLDTWDITRLSNSMALRGAGYNNDFEQELGTLGHSLYVLDSPVAVLVEHADEFGGVIHSFDGYHVGTQEDLNYFPNEIAQVLDGDKTRIANALSTTNGDSVSELDAHVEQTLFISNAHTSRRKLATAPTDSYIILSDPQLTWTGEQDTWSNFGKTFHSYFKANFNTRDKAAIHYNEKMVEKIKDLKTNDSSIGTVIINGDLTSFGSKDGNLDKYRDIWNYNDLRDEGLLLMVGLGNHDYKNSIDDCGTPWWSTWNSCAVDMVYYFRDLKENYKGLNHFNIDASNTKTKYKFTKGLYAGTNGSFAYSWTENGVHFVQLHDNPSFEGQIDSHSYIVPGRTIIDIKQSWDWLEKDLTAAVARGESIFLLMHDATDSEFTDTRNKLTALGDKFPISGIFAGHNHTSLGWVDTLTTTHGNIPIFKSGAVHYGVGFQMDVDHSNNQYNLSIFNVFPDDNPVPKADKLPIYDNGLYSGTGTYTFSPFPLR